MPIAILKNSFAILKNVLSERLKHCLLIVFLRFILYFCSLMTMDSYILTLCLVTGASVSSFLFCAWKIWKLKKPYRFQRIFAVLLAMHAIAFLNFYIFALLDHLPQTDYINTLMVCYDFCLVGGYTAFCLELVFPMRRKITTLLLIPASFVALMLLYAFTGNEIVYLCDIVLAFAVVVPAYITVEVAIKRHTRRLKDNVSNLQCFDLRWCIRVIRILMVFAGIWFVESRTEMLFFAQSQTSMGYLANVIYCLLSSVLVIFITNGVARQQIFNFSAQNDEIKESTGARNITQTYYRNSIHEDLDPIIREGKFYLQKDLSLSALAAAIGTNRQYLSNYINSEKGLTFYEYINNFRTDCVLEQLKQAPNPKELSLEEVIFLSGFNSYATFFRFFKKKYQITPSQYIQQLCKERGLE